MSRRPEDLPDRMLRLGHGPAQGEARRGCAALFLLVHCQTPRTFIAFTKNLVLISRS
jgi:hypothetical protein